MLSVCLMPRCGERREKQSRNISRNFIQTITMRLAASMVLHAVSLTMICPQKKGVITLSFLCYLITCGFVPYYYDEATNLCYGDGLFNLFFGWCCFVFPGIFTKIYSLAWFSNITYIVAIRHLIKGNRKHFVLWICITIILSSLLIICPRTETDTWGNIHHFTLTIGYYLRIISFFILFVGGIYVLFVQNRKGDKRLTNDGRMKSKQQIFFLTKSDIVKMMTVVERKIPIEYTLIGAFKQETIRRENTRSNFSI